MCDEWEDLSWDLYAECVRWCDAGGADTVDKLARRILSKEDYDEKWNRRCDEIHRRLEGKS